MKKNIFILSIFFLLSAVSVWSQTAMGKWRTHFSYNSVSQITQSERRIFAVSNGALFSVDKLEKDVVESYSKISGLSGSDVSRICYDPMTRGLLVAYSNGNIDFIESGGVTNIPDLYNKQLGTSKTVRDISFYDNKAYLSCDFGVLVLNLKKKEVADTYVIGDNGTYVSIYSTTQYNGRFYALSSTTVYNALVSEPHLANYEYWQTTQNIPGSGTFQKAISFADYLVVLRGGVLYKMDNQGVWSMLFGSFAVSDFVVSNNKLIINSSGGAFALDQNLTLIPLNVPGYSIQDAEYDAENNLYWFAAAEKGLVSLDPTSNQLSEYKPNGPVSNSAWSMTFAGKTLYVVSGGRASAQFGRPGNVMMYQDGKWKNILNSSIIAQTGRPVSDFMNIAVDPANSHHYFVSSYGTGLYEFRNDTLLKWYNYTNSTLQTHPAVSGNPWEYTRLDGAAVDKEGNLFVNNSAVAKGVKIRKVNGEWTELGISGATMDISGLTLINNQQTTQKWVTSYRSSEVGVFDDNGTLDNKNDDKSIVLKALADPDNLGQTIPFQYTYAIAQDRDGVIWLGTDKGPILFHNTSTVFDPGYTGSRVKISRNDGTGQADYLLVDEEILSIAIDGANRKWIGTKNSGVYLLSESGQEILKHFTTANSPLLSNSVLALAINSITGEVFMGTGLGIVSYQSDAAEAGNDFDNVHAYPNPVRQNFNGIITITGLVANTHVKITDLTGNLVCETISNGSIATWDGKNAWGKKVSTGIYLAICVNEDGTKSTLTKIMFIN